jgi:hypothetical protein
LLEKKAVLPMSWGLTLGVSLAQGV